MINNTIHQQELNSPVRKTGMEVSLFTGDTLNQVFQPSDALKSVKIERLGESKFFGIGIGQKVNVKLVDTERRLQITTDNSLVIQHDVGGNLVGNYPVFYVTEVHRDEKTNELSITAYDALHEATSIPVRHLDVFGKGYTLQQFGESCARILGLGFEIKQVAPIEVFNTNYPTGGNFDGTETIREALDDLAEATQTFYFVLGNKLVFKRLNTEPVVVINKDNYITLKNGAGRRLSRIVNATELGNNIEVKTQLSGTTQYVRDNAFWTLREDIDTLMNEAIKVVGNFTINQFDCSWRGNYLLELGDCISITTKDNKAIVSYLLNDSIQYDGSLSERTSWNYQDPEETESKPASLGEALNKTFARVDKANKQIDIVASDTKANSEAISALQLTTNEITADVTNVRTEFSEAMEGMGQDIVTIRDEVNAKMDADSIDIAIKKAIENGTDRVETQTGFTFDEQGLTISKSDKEMTTTITEDGMTVQKNNSPVLTANNEGVRAEDLHATTYLIIGNNSRFEDYGNKRTGCFWIGG